MRRYLAGVAAVVLLIAAAPAHAASPNVLVIDPDTGEPLSGGVATTFFGDDSSFAARYDGVSVFLDVGHLSPQNVFDGWNIQFAAPPGQPLQVGTYSEIARAPFRSWGQAGWDATHVSTGCNTVSGSFTVNTFSPGPLGYLNGGYYFRVLSFDADWEIHCSDAPEVLRGHVHYEDPPDTTPPTFGNAFDQQLEAQDANGAVATYHVYGFDDYTGQYLDATCSPASGSLFPIGTTIVSCSAVDPAGNQGSTSFAVTILPRFEFAIRATEVRVPARGGPLTVTGTVSCNRSAGIRISVSATQQVTRRAAITASADTFVSCDAPSAVFVLELVSPSGAFLPGKATMTSSGEAYTLGWHVTGPTSETLNVRVG